MSYNRGKKVKKSKVRSPKQLELDAMLKVFINEIISGDYGDYFNELDTEKLIKAATPKIKEVLNIDDNSIRTFCDIMIPHLSEGMIFQQDENGKTVITVGEF